MGSDDRGDDVRRCRRQLPGAAQPRRGRPAVLVAARCGLSRALRRARLLSRQRLVSGDEESPHLSAAEIDVELLALLGRTAT